MGVSMSGRSEVWAETLDLLCYFMAASPSPIYEPRLYAPFRLAEGAYRLIMLMEKVGISDPEWRAVGEEVERRLLRAINDEESCKRILDDIVLRLATQLKQS